MALLTRGDFAAAQQDLRILEENLHLGNPVRLLITYTMKCVSSR